MGNIIAETLGGGTTGATGTVREYIYLYETEIAPTMGSRTVADRPLAVVEAVNTVAPVTYWVSVDHLNRPVKMTNAAKASVWDAVWQPFGGAHSITGSATLNARLPGQWFQSETGLHYNWHRSYDPSLGRYTQPDPLGFVDGPSVYGYGLGSPLIFVDLTGENAGRGGGRRGERGATGGSSGRGTDNPYKHCRPLKGDDTKIECQDHQTGQWKTKPKPADWDDYKKKSEMCDADCIGVTQVVIASGVTYIVYRCLRLVPSLLPPLWPTLGPNLALP
jgi:RHS repeat-associated protein